MLYQDRHDEAFYEQRERELAPYWQEHLAHDGKLLDQVLLKVMSAKAPLGKPEPKRVFTPEQREARRQYSRQYKARMKAKAMGAAA